MVMVIPSSPRIELPMIKSALHYSLFFQRMTLLRKLVTGVLNIRLFSKYHETIRK